MNDVNTESGADVVTVTSTSVESVAVRVKFALDMVRMTFVKVLMTVGNTDPRIVVGKEIVENAFVEVVITDPGIVTFLVRVSVTVVRLVSVVAAGVVRKVLVTVNMLPPEAPQGSDTIDGPAGIQPARPGNCTEYAGFATR